MICNKCSAVLDEKMNFCPICGNQVGQSCEITPAYENKIAIEKLWSNKEYDQILDFALAGDNVAKCYYIEYILDQATKGYFYDWKAIFEKLICESNSNDGFATAAYGIFLYEHGKKGNLGVSNTSEMESGYKLIRKAADMKEPAAMTEYGSWLCSGNDYVKKDEYRGYQLIKQSADAGYPKAIRTLGYWHYKGTGNVSKNEELGFKLIERAAFIGEHSARYIVSQIDPDWLNEDLSFSLSDEAIRHITQQVAPEEKPKAEEEIDKEKLNQNFAHFTRLEKCNSLEDYKSLYKQLEQNSDAASEDARSQLAIIRKIILLLSGVSGAEQAKRDKEKALALLNQYNDLEQFLSYKEDLTQTELSFDRDTMSELMKNASDLIESKSPRQCKSYLSYIAALAEKHSVKKKLIQGILWVIAALTVGIFSILIGTIIGIVAFLHWIAMIRNQRKARKRLMATKQDFSLIHSLMLYGYKIRDFERYYVYSPRDKTVKFIFNQ